MTQPSVEDMTGIKTTLILVLLLANIYLMAWESISKYLEKGIVIEVSTEETDGQTAPAITFCATSKSG